MGGVYSRKDISTTSLHATKLLTCGEGGGCVTNDEILLENLNKLGFSVLTRTERLDEMDLTGKCLNYMLLLVFVI